MAGVSSRGAARTVCVCSAAKVCVTPPVLYNRTEGLPRDSQLTSRSNVAAIAIASHCHGHCHSHGCPCTETDARMPLLSSALSGSPVGMSRCVAHTNNNAAGRPDGAAFSTSADV